MINMTSSTYNVQMSSQLIEFKHQNEFFDNLEFQQIVKPQIRITTLELYSIYTCDSFEWLLDLDSQQK